MKYNVEINLKTILKDIKREELITLLITILIDEWDWKQKTPKQYINRLRSLIIDNLAIKLNDRADFFHQYGGDFGYTFDKYQKELKGAKTPEELEAIRKKHRETKVRYHSN